MKHEDRSQTPAKKAYQSPVLQVYGSIRSMTQQVGVTGMNDPGNGSTTKTGL